MANQKQESEGHGKAARQGREVRLIEVELEDFGSAAASGPAPARSEGEPLEPVYDVPVKVRAVLGKASLEVNQLLNLEAGTVLELDRRVGEPVDVYVNDRLVARGEVVIVDDHLGVTMTEIVGEGGN